jgi:hypothetical protein
MLSVGWCAEYNQRMLPAIKIGQKAKGKGQRAKGRFLISLI